MIARYFMQFLEDRAYRNIFKRLLFAAGIHWLKVAMETLEQCVKSVQNSKQRHQLNMTPG